MQVSATNHLSAKKKKTKAVSFGNVGWEPGSWSLHHHLYLFNQLLAVRISSLFIIQEAVDPYRSIPLQKKAEPVIKKQ